MNLLREWDIPVSLIADMSSQYHIPNSKHEDKRSECSSKYSEYHFPIRRIPFFSHRESSYVWNNPRLEFTAESVIDYDLWTIFLHYFDDILDGFFIFSQSGIKMIEFFKDLLRVRIHKWWEVRRWDNRWYLRWFFRDFLRWFSSHLRCFLPLFLRFLHSSNPPRFVVWW